MGARKDTAPGRGYFWEQATGITNFIWASLGEPKGMLSSPGIGRALLLGLLPKEGSIFEASSATKVGVQEAGSSI